MFTYFYLTPPKNPQTKDLWVVQMTPCNFLKQFWLNKEHGEPLFVVFSTLKI